jgi:type I restriction enzyme, S subunit
VSKKTIDELLGEMLVLQEEQPFEVLQNWLYIELENICEYIQRGKSPKYVELSNARVVSQKCVQWDGFDISVPRYIDEETLKSYKDERFLRKNDILWNSTGTGTIGRVAIINEDFEGTVVADSHVTVVRPNSKVIDSQFLYRWLSSPFVQNKLNNAWSGSTNQVELNLTTVRKQVIPLPPLNEQKRIAEKVEYLLSKIDEAKQLIEDAKKTFELRRAAILDKAFRGELTKRWRDENNDIDIFELQYHLNNIRNSKESSPIKSNTLNIKPVSLDDEPFELPRGWKWVRLGELSYYVTSGSRDWSKYYADKGSYFIRTQDINKNKLNLENVAHVILPEKVEGKRSLVEPFDLLTTITGANVGKCAVVEDTLPEAYVSQSVALTKLIDKSMAKYVHLSLLSTSGGGGELENRAYGIGRPVLSLEDIKNIKLPIAPYKERQIIVDLVKNLLDKEDKTVSILMLEEKLDQLEQSILSKAFRGELGTNDSSEESSIELLKEVVKEQIK